MVWFLFFFGSCEVIRVQTVYKEQQMFLLFLSFSLEDRQKPLDCTCSMISVKILYEKLDMVQNVSSTHCSLPSIYLCPPFPTTTPSSLLHKAGFSTTRCYEILLGLSPWQQILNHFLAAMFPCAPAHIHFQLWCGRVVLESLSVTRSSWRTVHLWTEFKCCDREGMLWHGNSTPHFRYGVTCQCVRRSPDFCTHNSVCLWYIAHIPCQLDRDACFCSDVLETKSQFINNSRGCDLGPGLTDSWNHTQFVTWRLTVYHHCGSDDLLF